MFSKQATYAQEMQKNMRRNIPYLVMRMEIIQISLMKSLLTEKFLWRIRRSTMR
jgi:hypothetical protein